MTDWQDVEYTVILVFPGFGTERESAEEVVQSALDWLNANKEKPGFRFAPPVSAHLEIVSDADEATARIEEDESVAMVLLHDLDEGERDDLARLCQARDIGVCITVEAPRQSGPRDQPWRFTLRKTPPDEVPAHQLSAGTLTDPVEDEEDTAGRVSEVIAVLALGVMQHHWHKNPPRVLERFQSPPRQPGTGG